MKNTLAILDTPRTFPPSVSLTEINTSEHKTVTSNTNLPAPILRARENKTITDFEISPQVRQELRSQHWTEFSWKVKSNQGCFFEKEKSFMSWSDEKKQDWFAWTKVAQELVKINLKKTSLGNDVVKALKEAVEENMAIKSLELRITDIDDKGAQAFAQALNHNTSLNALELGWNKIGAEGAKALAHALKHNTSLQGLNLDINLIGPVGAKALAQALENNSSLTTLKLQCNQIGSLGAHDIAVALKSNTTLINLKIRGNKIGHKGVKDLSQALKMNGALKKLNLIENKIDDADAKDIAEALKINTSLNSLKLENNKIGPAGTKEIAEALKNNTSLTKLYLQHNEIGYEGENALIEALKINSIMTNLNYFILNRNSKFEAGGDADVDTALNMDDNSDTDTNTDGDTEVIAGRENEVHGLLYRNTLWPLTYGAGVGMSNMINQQYSESINTFPSEVGNLIAKNMLSVGIKDENLVEDFQQIENNLKEIMYGAALHNNPTPIDFI